MSPAPQRASSSVPGPGGGGVSRARRARKGGLTSAFSEGRDHPIRGNRPPGGKARPPVVPAGTAKFHIFAAVPPCFRTFRGRCSAIRTWGYRGHPMPRPAMILVGADSGGVGKTTVSRTLLDFFASRKVTTHAFDTEHPRGALARFHPGITDVIDVTAVPDQLKIFGTIAVVVGAGHRDRHPCRPDAADAARAARHRRHRQGQEGPAQSRGLPHSRALDRLPRGDRGNREIPGRCPLRPGQELRHRHHLLRLGPADLQFLFQPHQGCGRDQGAEAQRDGLRGGRAVVGAVRELHRRPQGERRGRLELVRAARLCPPLAQQRVGRVRPRAADGPDRRAERVASASGMPIAAAS